MMLEHTNHNSCSCYDSTLFEGVVKVLVSVAVEQPYSYRVRAGDKVARGQIVKVPLGPRQILGVVWGDDDGTLAADKIKPVSQIYDIPPLGEDICRLVDWLANYTLAQPGMILRACLRSEKALEPPKPLIGYRTTFKRPARLTVARQRLLALAEDGLARTKAQWASLADVSVGVVDGLMKAGAFESVKIAQSAAVGAPNPRLYTPDRLKPAQYQAYERLLPDNLDAFRVDVLEGVTGSGKTEVYFEIIAAHLAQQRQVLVLLPEIALTTAFLARFEHRFGAKPGLWHSDMTASQRDRMFYEVIRGNVDIVIGARSALFLPFPNLGLIVVDEEHEAAYKQTDRVSYHARDMAIVRAKFAKAQVILASATPAVETVHNVQIGKYHHVTLDERFDDAQLPDIELIDMREEPLERDTWISPQLRTHIHRVLEKGEQALLFLNRRGYAPLTLCRSCGYRYQCPQCSAWLVEHRFVGKLSCHHCGYERPCPTVCDSCAQPDALHAIGPGIERVAEEAARLFPEAVRVILSSDVGGPQALKARFEAIEQGRADLVIGTQLVAKGHHFENLTLVGVLDADLGLAHGDPRAAERTFQLLTQVTGRAGRGAKRGRALLQTYVPEHDVMQAIQHQDKAKFYAHELLVRQEGALPPFARLANLIISAKKRDVAFKFAQALRIAAPEHDRVDLLGPADAPIAMIRGRSRVRLMAKSAKNEDLSAYIRSWLKNGPKPRGNVRIQVDIDPISFY